MRKNHLTEEQKDRRRQLIRKDVDGEITEEEKEELKILVHEFFEVYASPIRRENKEK
jgi:hypothetical protein